MQNQPLEIERKFFVSSQDPEFIKITESHTYNKEERYYLYRKDGIEIRFTKISRADGIMHFNLDRIELKLDSDNDSHISRKKERLMITEDEFNSLLGILKTSDPNVQPIERHSYTLGTDPKMEFKVYKGRFEGLNRLEVEFDSNEAASAYIQPIWAQKEITDLPVGKDIELPNLSDEDLNKILQNLL